MCDALVWNGFDDWFLPSRDELNLMYLNLKRQNLGRFSGSGYWSSSQSLDAACAWNQRFSTGTQGINTSKSEANAVCAVRAF